MKRMVKASQEPDEIRLPRIAMDYPKLFELLGFKKIEYRWCALSADGKDVLLYNELAEACFIYTNAALDDEGASFLNNLPENRQGLVFMDEHNIDEIRASFEQMMERMGSSTLYTHI